MSLGLFFSPCDSSVLSLAYLKKIFILAMLGLCCWTGFSLSVLSGGSSSLKCEVFSLQWLLSLQSTGSRAQASVVAVRGLSSFDSRALKHRLNSCVAWSWLLHSMWDLSGPGIEPVSPALAGRFFTTEPRGEPCILFLKQKLI